MNPGYLLLRIFSGPHMGAELVLPMGTYLVGGDDSCDIILQDSTLAPRHATLEVALGNDGTPKLHVAPLDGQVTVHEESLGEEGGDLPESTPCFLGMTAFAWATQDHPAEVWQAVSTRLQEKRVATTGEAEQTLPADEPVLLDQPLTTELEELSFPADKVVAKTVWERLRGVSPQRLAVFFLVSLALCGLTFSYEGRTPAAQRRVDQVIELVNKAGFSTLVVSPMGQGVTVQGVIRNDAERAELLKMAQNVHYPLYLDVTIRGDRVDAVQAAFSSRGFPLEVREKSDDPAQGLHISGYVRDGLVEESLFSSVREDIPSFQSESVWNQLEKNVRHASEVEAVLKPRLAEAKLNFVQLRYLPGKIEVIGSFDVEQRRTLEQALDATRQLLGVPVAFEVLAPQEARRDREDGRISGARASAASPGQLFPGGKEDRHESVPDMRVTGVTLSPMRFINLATGQRVFEGGLLPGGFVLESIGAQALTLRKEGQSILYRLRGSDE